jgi:hypothetical protein
VVLKEGDTLGYLLMIPPSSAENHDEWVVKVGTGTAMISVNPTANLHYLLLNVLLLSLQENITEAKLDPRYHFLVEDGGYLLNKGISSYTILFFNT